MVGYHSNRRVPARSAITAAEHLYKRIRIEERRHERPQDAVEAGTATLERILSERGRTYDELVWDLAAGNHGAAGESG